MLYPPNAKFRIYGNLYEQANEPATKGDLVMDSHDNTYGYVDSLHSDGVHASVRDGQVVEIGIPIVRLQKLIPTLDPNSLN